MPYRWTFNSLGFPENKAGLKGETREYYPGSHNGIGGSLETPKVAAKSPAWAASAAPTPAGSRWASPGASRGEATKRQLSAEGAWPR